jgi:RIO-like serine/threonine protein kinase
VHGDLHPNNMIITKDGRVVMIDFGQTKHVSTVTGNDIAVNMLKDVDYFIARWPSLFLTAGSPEYNEIKSACDHAILTGSVQLPFAMIYGACWRLLT